MPLLNSFATYGTVTQAGFAIRAIHNLASTSHKSFAKILNVCLA